MFVSDILIPDVLWGWNLGSNVFLWLKVEERDDCNEVERKSHEWKIQLSKRVVKSTWYYDTTKYMKYNNMKHRNKKPCKWSKANSDPEMSFIVGHKTEERWQNCSQQRSIEWCNSRVPHGLRMKTKDELSESSDETTECTTKTSLDMTKQDGDKDEEAKEGVVDKYCLKY